MLCGAERQRGLDTPFNRKHPILHNIELAYDAGLARIANCVSVKNITFCWVSFSLGTESKEWGCLLHSLKIKQTSVETISKASRCRLIIYKLIRPWNKRKARLLSHRSHAEEYATVQYWQLSTCQCDLMSNRL